MTQNMGDSRPIILTGFASGIGKAIDEYLQSFGCTIIRVGRSLRHDLEGRDSDINWNFQFPTPPKDFIYRVSRLAPEGVFGIINCAAIADATPFDQITVTEFQNMMTVNVVSPWSLVAALQRVDAIRNEGRVINIGSISSLTGFSGHAHYCASKFALRGLTMVLAKELAKKRITCNMIAPGPTDTPMWDRLEVQYADMAGPGVHPSQIGEVAASRGLFGRIGKPEDVTGVVKFLLSDEASFITGTTLNVSGGNLLG